MPSSNQEESRQNQEYLLIFDILQRERFMLRIEFLGMLIITAIFAFVSLSGKWWPPLLGLVTSLVWLAIAARSIGLQNLLHEELVNIAKQDEINRTLRLHCLTKADSKLPVTGQAEIIVRSFTNNVFIYIPGALIVAWFIGFILSLD